MEPERASAIPELAHLQSPVLPPKCDFRRNRRRRVKALPALGEIPELRT
jgi:hypothetical protein